MKLETQDMRNRTVALFCKAGVSESDAAILADVLLETEMRGVFTHGIYRVPFYLRCLKSGGISPKCELSVTAETPSHALADGKGGLGIVLSYKAMELAMQKARETGIGVVNVCGSHHFGAAGYYTGMCAENKMVGMAMSNGDVLVAATGSRKRTIGNNPFAFSAPAGKFDKVVYDIAMSYTSDQKVLKLAREGKPLPPGWVIDKDGRETLDASAYEAGGTLMPFGGYKGYGLAMMVETLAAALSGAAMTQNVHAWNQNPEQNGNVGHCFIAMDISKTQDVDVFEHRMEDMISEIKASEKAEGFTEILYPGELELRKLAECRKTGLVDIADATVAAFEEAEKEYGLR